ncbi:hypothetical protein DFS34DRAFT_61590 [Phlyctochytrium arcticum]|nr:hypothetical protein DFS34DRAFT_61590 [Phlyctochytrium arcticum]
MRISSCDGFVLIKVSFRQPPGVCDQNPRLHRYSKAHRRITNTRPFFVWPKYNQRTTLTFGNNDDNPRKHTPLPHHTPPRSHHTFRDKSPRATRRNPVSNTQASTCTSTHNLNLHINTQPQPARQDLHPGSRCRAAKHGRLSYGAILIFILILIQTTSHTQLRHPPQPTSPSPMYPVSGHQSLPCLIAVSV